jgi:hypothetical protein
VIKIGLPARVAPEQSPPRNAVLEIHRLHVHPLCHECRSKEVPIVPLCPTHMRAGKWNAVLAAVLEKLFNIICF